MSDHFEQTARAWNSLAKSWAALQGEAGDANQRWTINPALFALCGDVVGQRVWRRPAAAGTSPAPSHASACT